MREGKGEIGLNIQVASLAAATLHFIVFILSLISGGLAKSGQESWELKVNLREGRKKGMVLEMKSVFKPL